MTTGFSIWGQSFYFFVVVFSNDRQRLAYIWLTDFKTANYEILQGLERRIGQHQEKISRK